MQSGWLENEQPELNQEDLDLTDLVDTIAEDARYEYPEHHIRTELPEQAEIRGTSHRALAQAIENVVRNACKYTPAGGTVMIRLQEEAGGYRLSVEDDGPGVPAEQLEAIFRPFFRATRIRESVPSGHGLGLALASRHLDAIGGESGPVILRGTVVWRCICGCPQSGCNKCKTGSLRDTSYRECTPNTNHLHNGVRS